MNRRAATARLALAASASSFALVLLLPARAEARSCTEVSDIVGEEKCSRYGRDWSLEGTFPVTFRFGMRYSELSVAGTTFKEDIHKQGRPAGYVPYRYSGEALGVGSLSGLGLDGGFAFFVYGQLYFGLEGGFSVGSASTASFTTATHVALSNDGGLNVSLFHAGIPIGYRIPLGRASLRGEFLFGFVDGSVDHHVEAAGLPSSGSASAMWALIEPRVAGDIWFTQHVSFGVFGGVNLLDTGGNGRALGMTLTWHNRAFDGDSSF